MKNGKAPTSRQKKLIKSYGPDPDHHLVVKNTPDFLEVVSRTALKRKDITGKKHRTRKLPKDSIVRR